MASKGKSDRWKQEASPILMVIAGVILVLILGAAGFYAFNGGWKTPAQQDEQYKHEILPIMAARHGDTGPLEAENKLRASQGQSPLKMPEKQKGLQDTGNDRQKLLELQQKLQGRVNN